MNLIDYPIIAFVNSFVTRFRVFDSLVMLLARNQVLKAVPIMMLFTWAWFREDENGTHRRRTLVFGLGASWAAVFIARMLAVIIPFRERPLHDRDLHFVLPHSVDPQDLIQWSSFPSDNATLFFGVATCILLVSRRAGILAFCHALIVVGFARVYLGFHYPTDILAGALIGVGTVYATCIASTKGAVAHLPMRWLERHPPSFYAVLFIFIYFTATMADPLIPLVQRVLKTSVAGTLRFRTDSPIAPQLGGENVH